MDKNIFALIAFISLVGGFLQLLQILNRLHHNDVISMKSEKSSSFEETEQRMGLKRTILNRGCSMVKSLYEMSTNGTSFEELLTWHQRIENISFPLSNDGKNCYPPFLDPEAPLVMYQIHTENSRLVNKNVSWL